MNWRDKIIKWVYPGQDANDPKIPSWWIIKKAALMDGMYYLGNCRNAAIARWDAKLEVFWHWRDKWGDRYLESIKHAEDFDGYDVFKPTSELGMDPTIPFETSARRSEMLDKPHGQEGPL